MRLPVGSVKKRYIAIVDGYLDLQHSIWSVIDLPIIVDWPNRPRRVIDVVHGKPSMTRAGVTLSYIDAMETTLIELEPVTGRSHQLRVHLLAMGHAIVGDALYANQRIQVKSDRLLLHARSIEFPHPVSGQPVQFRSQDPF
jgi:tRNA pseudouridine32 synthase/23S rRNA pseudouridine746 synthase